MGIIRSQYRKDNVLGSACELNLTTSTAFDFRRTTDESTSDQWCTRASVVFMADQSIIEAKQAPPDHVNFRGVSL